MNRGYIKIWRLIEDKGLLQMPETFAVMVYLLMQATHKPVKKGTKYGVIELDRGQGITAIRKLSDHLKISVRSIRTILDRLTNMEILTLKPTHNYSIYTIVNYNKYQDVSEEVTQQPTHHRHTTDTPPTQEQALKHLSIKELNLNTMHPSDASSPPAEKPPKADQIPYQKIIDLYHQTLPTLPKVEILTTKRKGQIASRWRNGLPDLPTWKEYFEHISESGFLMGKKDPSNGHKRFIADLEWLTNETNFAKVAEGKYHGV